MPGIIRVRTNVRGHAGTPPTSRLAIRIMHADVVEHQPEEGVDVAAPGPGVAGAWFGCSTAVDSPCELPARETESASRQSAVALPPAEPPRAPADPPANRRPPSSRSTTPRPNDSDAMPTTVGATKPPVQPTRVHQPRRGAAVLRGDHVEERGEDVGIVDSLAEPGADQGRRSRPAPTSTIRSRTRTGPPGSAPGSAPGSGRPATAARPSRPPPRPGPRRADWRAARTST